MEKMESPSLEVQDKCLKNLVWIPCWACYGQRVGLKTSWSPIPPGKTYIQRGLCAARGWNCALPIISNTVPYFCFKTLPTTPRNHQEVPQFSCKPSEFTSSRKCPVKFQAKTEGAWLSLPARCFPSLDHAAFILNSSFPTQRSHHLLITLKSPSIIWNHDYPNPFHVPHDIWITEVVLYYYYFSIVVIIVH